jgi:nucleoside-diphosphate-sugar epimerase
MAQFTVLGANGFIGRHLMQHLQACGHAVSAPARGVHLADRQTLGHVIYAIGLTADFRTRPYKTMEAHVCLLGDFLRRARFESFTYLSSTRLYGGAGSTGEDADLSVNPNNPGDLYNLSKLAGEALCLVHSQPTVRVARLSNVYGSGMGADGAPSQNFLAAVIREAVQDGRIVLRTAPQSAKDYVAIDDVVRALRRIALSGTRRIYNVACGRNVSHAELAAGLARLTGCAVDAVPGASLAGFPVIDTSRIETLFAQPDDPWSPAALPDRLPALVAQFADLPVPALGGAA